jgi:hypothetical protein
MVEYVWTISVVGNVITLVGAFRTARAVILTEQQAVEISASPYGGPNQKLATALRDQSEAAKYGLYWVVFGTALQILREFIEHGAIALAWWWL